MSPGVSFFGTHVGHFPLESGISLGGDMAARRNRFSGILYREGEEYLFHSLEDSSSVALNPVLERVAGEEVHLGIHAEPEGCKWYPAPCPAGHHDAPYMALTFQERGTLIQTEEGWVINDVRVPLHIFEGHICDFEVYPSVQALGARAERLRRVLRKVRDL